MAELSMMDVKATSSTPNLTGIVFVIETRALLTEPASYRLPGAGANSASRQGKPLAADKSRSRLAPHPAV
jgi:hypothetical protein